MNHDILPARSLGMRTFHVTGPNYASDLMDFLRTQASLGGGHRT